jgi:membrane protein implicated in regulation of membrane protease activity
MLATDPLSLLFLGCALFSGLFLVAAVILGAGGHGHLGHIGHAGHLGHIGHLGAGDGATSGHASGHAVGHASGQSAAHVAHATPAQGEGQTSVAAQTEGVWGMAQSLLLGSLNLNGALIFLLVFGVLGYLLNIGQATPLLVILLLAALVGAAAAIGVNAALTRIFITSQAGELSTDNSRLEGRLATVSIGIRERGLGEVVYSGEAGARHSVGARSSDGASIPAGAQVVIVAADGGLATVQQWERFLDETRQRLSADPQAPRLEPGPAPAAPPGADVAEPTPRE